MTETSNPGVTGVKSHDPTPTPSGTGWRGDCPAPCLWLGPQRLTEREAMDDCARHYTINQGLR